MKFTEFKDRSWMGYDWLARKVIRLPPQVARTVFGGIGPVFRASWLVPNSPVRQTFVDLARISKRGSAKQIFRSYVRNFVRATYRMEILRHKGPDEIAAMLECPDKARLDALAERGGVILVMPHAHASILAAAALAQDYPMLLLARSTKNDARAAWQNEYYERMSCDVLDVRRADDVVASRALLSALRGGKIVLAAGDFISKPPVEPDDPERDVVRVEAFSEPVGAMRWPARFGAKLNAPIVPVMITQSETNITLHLGDVVEPGDMVETTQAWMNGLTQLIVQHPSDWLFCLDRKWRKVLDGPAAPKDNLQGFQSGESHEVRT